ncbi:MAG: helix-turn-helix domain-containing protein [Bacteroidota bacterium]
MAKHDDYITEQLDFFGKRLKTLRKKKGYTNYEQFAYEHRIGRAQYGRYEKGADIRLSSLLKLLRAMEITPVEFFGEGFEFRTAPEEEPKS